MVKEIRNGLVSLSACSGDLSLSRFVVYATFNNNRDLQVLARKKVVVGGGAPVVVVAAAAAAAAVMVVVVRASPEERGRHDESESTTIALARTSEE